MRGGIRFGGRRRRWWIGESGGEKRREGFGGPFAVVKFWMREAQEGLWIGVFAAESSEARKIQAIVKYLDYDKR